MAKIQKKMNEHPNAVGKTYFGHMYDSLYYATYTLGVGVIFTIHAIFPFLYEHTGSSMIEKLNDVLQERQITIKQSEEREIQTEEKTESETEEKTESETVNKTKGENEEITSKISCCYTDQHSCYTQTEPNTCFYD